MQVWFVDHYDSFTFNLIDWLTQSGLVVKRIVFDDAKKLEVLHSQPAPIILGPGPHSPRDVQPSLHLVEALSGKVPLFGVCLGHQILGVQLGYQIKKAQDPRHGSLVTTRSCHPLARDQGLAGEHQVGVYHSLVLEQTPHALGVVTTRETTTDEIMGIYAQKESSPFPSMGVQFHPESFLSQSMDGLKSKWHREVRRYYSEIGTSHKP